MLLSTADAKLAPRPLVAVQMTLVAGGKRIEMEMSPELALGLSAQLEVAAQKLLEKRGSQSPGEELSHAVSADEQPPRLTAADRVNQRQRAKRRYRDTEG